MYLKISVTKKAQNAMQPCWLSK